MTWCDKLASTPAIGVKLDPYLVSGDALFDALSPLINGFVSDGEPRVNVERHETTSISFVTDDGFSFGVDKKSLHVQVTHRVKAVPTSGGLPELKLLSNPMPFSLILPVAARYVLDSVALLPKIETRSITRIGVVTLTSVSEEDLPPGVSKMIEYFGRPWGRGMDHFSLSASAEVAATDDWTAKCIHTITKPEGDELMTLHFDWGMHFKSPKPLTKTILKARMEEAQNHAMAYFELLGEGSMFDEQLIRERAGL